MSDDGIQLHEWQSWTPKDVKKYFTENELSEAGIILKRQKIKGSHLLRITYKMLEDMGVKTEGERCSVIDLIENLTKRFETKVFNDPVHGHIEFGPLLMKIIDTPQFQRLRFIKQLGCCYFVFPGAAHNRFEHSLGVCYLAGELLLSLQRNQPELKITKKDILCVQIAGLCHDLGHGPFSHVFDSLVIPSFGLETKLKHENLSVRMFDHLIKQEEVAAELEKNGLEDCDRTFIREQIEGKLQNQNAWPYKGRGPEKSFLYDVVANKKNGNDVDKWDYFARDCHHLGIANTFNHQRYMKFARVIGVEGMKQICSRNKETYDLYLMFQTRYTLHRRAYQHKVNSIIGRMIADALIKANEHLRIFPGSDRRMLTMSESLDDMHAYTHLTDGVLEHILISNNENLEESKEIINRVLTRKLYKSVGEVQLPADKGTPEGISRTVSEEELNGYQLDPDDLVFDVVKMDYGMGNENPVDKIWFYLKEDPNKAVKIEKKKVSQMLGENFSECYIRAYCKRPEKHDEAKKYFDDWCKQKQKSESSNGSGKAPATPMKTPAEDKPRTETKARKNLNDDFNSCKKRKRRKMSGKRM